MKTKDQNRGKGKRQRAEEDNIQQTKEGGERKPRLRSFLLKTHKIRFNLRRRQSIYPSLSSLLPSSPYTNLSVPLALPCPSLDTTLPVLLPSPFLLRLPVFVIMQTSEKKAAAEGGHGGSGCCSKPFAIRVSSVGGTVLPLQEALGNIKNLAAGTINLSPGYDSYTRRLLMPLPTEYDMANHDDLSADEAYELPTPRNAKVCSLLTATHNFLPPTPVHYCLPFVPTPSSRLPFMHVPTSPRRLCLRQEGFCVL